MALVAPGHTQRYFGPLLYKMAGRPMAFLYAAVVMVTAYVVVEHALRWQPAGTLLSPVRILGSKGLPGYAALQVTVLVLDLFPRAPRNDLVVLAVIVICGVTEYSAVQLQLRRRQQVPRTGGVTSDIVGDEPTGEPPTANRRALEKRGRARRPSWAKRAPRRADRADAAPARSE
jgi:hypothetical protein